MSLFHFCSLSFIIISLQANRFFFKCCRFPLVHNIFAMKSPKSPTGPDDGPEEGEIVSDELEDISDESINFTSSFGKSLSRSDHSHALSLSSVTDLDEPPADKRRKRRKSYSIRQAKRQKKRKKSVDSDSSDNDISMDNRLKHQLKAAVRVDIKEAHRNSLRTRLLAMVKGGSGPESDNVESKQENGTITISEGATESSITVIDLVEQDANSCIEIVASSPENADSSTEQVKGEDIDSELIQLRLEALKTAINNKFANRRKKRKENSDDTNKENTNNNSEENEIKNTPPNENKLEPPERPEVNDEAVNNVPISPEDDEDVLRALLLASMSKKITKTYPEPPTTLTKMAVINQKDTLLSKTKTNNFSLNNTVKKALQKKVVTKYSGATKLIRVPQVKPLIINVNSDSDSDWEFSSSSPEKSPIKLQKGIVPKPEPNKSTAVINKIENGIESTVEKFLKEQRAKVESKIVDADNAKPISNSKSVPQIVQKTLPVTAKKLEVAELEKSALKFLPANKREEYKKLQNLLRMKKAQLKKPRVRRMSQKATENGNNLKTAVINKNLNANHPNNEKTVPKPTQPNKNNDNFKAQAIVNNNLPSLSCVAKQGNIVKKLVRSKATQTINLHVQLTPQAEARITEFRREEERTAERAETKRHECLIMRTTLKQLQTKKDGRLQIQEKYKSLRPLVKKLNEVSKQQKQGDENIARLVAELAKAREKQEMLHRNMSASVKELAEEKKKIDLSISKLVSKPKPSSTLITSTPIKLSTTPAPLALSSSFASNNFCSDPNDFVSEHAINDKADRSESIMNTWEQSRVCANNTQAGDNNKCVSGNEESEITVVDPNNIDNFIKITEQCNVECKKSDIVKYVSPLDAIQRKDVLDPFGIMCPFEVNGTCKDPDCTYNHLPK